MAKEDSKIVLERTYTIPLSRELLKVAYYKKAKKAVRAVQKFLSKHMKSDDVKLMRQLNMKLWENGMKNPPKNIKVNVTKDDKGIVRAELFGAKVDKPKESKKPVKGAKKVVDVEAKSVDEKAEKAADIEKEDIAELKKELPKTHHHPQKQPKVAKEQPLHAQAPKSV